MVVGRPIWKIREEIIVAKIERFEDIQSWQKARQLANSIYDLTEHPKFSKDFRLSGQIQDAAGSVMHNIAEGFDAGTNPEFIRFLKMARRSASEVQSELYLALDRKYITDMNLTWRTVWPPKLRLINGMIGYLRKC